MRSLHLNYVKTKKRRNNSHIIVTCRIGPKDFGNNTRIIWIWHAYFCPKVNTMIDEKSDILLKKGNPRWKMLPPVVAISSSCLNASYSISWFLTSVLRSFYIIIEINMVLLYYQYIGTTLLKYILLWKMNIFLLWYKSQ